MTGIINTFPPITELPPGSASGPANLPPVTYQYAVLSLPQTWTGVQTFAFGTFQLAGSISGVTVLQPQTVAGGILSLPNGPDTLVGLASTGTFTNKTWNGATITVAFGGTGATSLTAHGILLGEGTGPVVATVAMTDGQLLVGQTGADPLPKTIGGDVAFSAAGATAIQPNVVTNAKAAQMAAFTLKGNAIGSTANATDISIPALTQKVTPVGADTFLIADSAAANALKFASISSITSAAGVSSIAGNTGAFTLGAGLTNSANILLVDAAYMRGYISGLTISNDVGSPNTVIDIATGVATSDDATTLMKLASAITKSNGAWAVGSAGGLDTGAFAASTWYHFFVIERTDTGVVDVLFSTSATSPTMPTNYTKKRRIGSARTNGSSNWIAFTQVSNQFTWAVPVLDFNSTVGTSRSTVTLTVPTGVVVSASVVANGGSSGNSVIWVGPLTVTDGAPSLTASPPGMLFFQNVAGATSSSGGVNMMTNTSAQVGARADTAATSLKLLTNGWTDFL